MLLMIDNYDSFTWNLVQYLGELGADVHVHRNDAITLTSTSSEVTVGIGDVRRVPAPLCPNGGLHRSRRRSQQSIRVSSFVPLRLPWWNRLGDWNRSLYQCITTIHLHQVMQDFSPLQKRNNCIAVDCVLSYFPGGHGTATSPKSKRSRNLVFAQDFR